jgi:competence CoiA-like predicted nuclease
MKATFTCPVCNKQVRDLKAHKERMHADGQKPVNETAPEEEEEEAEELEIDAEPEVVRGDADKYHCVDCGNPVTFKQAKCNCGASLDWSSIDG